MGFSRRESWNGRSSLLPGYLPNAGIKPMSLLSPSLAGGFLTTSTTWKQMFYNFMATVTILSDLGAQEKKICHCFYFFPFYLPWSDRTKCHDLIFCLMLSFKPVLSLFSTIDLLWIHLIVAPGFLYTILQVATNRFFYTNDNFL